MSLLNVTKANKMGRSEVRSMTSVGRLPQYILGAGLGLLGGAVGVALAIGLAIIIQFFLFPSVFAPGTAPMAFVAAVAGLGVSWLLGRGTRSIFPAPADDSDTLSKQVMLIFSVLISLLQTFLYMGM